MIFTSRVPPLTPVVFDGYKRGTNGLGHASGNRQAPIFQGLRDADPDTIVAQTVQRIVTGRLQGQSDIDIDNQLSAEGLDPAVAAVAWAKAGGSDAILLGALSLWATEQDAGFQGYYASLTELLQNGFLTCNAARTYNDAAISYYVGCQKIALRLIADGFLDGAALLSLPAPPLFTVSTVTNTLTNEGYSQVAYDLACPSGLLSGLGAAFGANDDAFLDPSTTQILVVQPNGSLNGLGNPALAPLIVVWAGRVLLGLILAIAGVLIIRSLNGDTKAEIQLQMNKIQVQQDANRAQFILNCIRQALQSAPSPDLSTRKQLLDQCVVSGKAVFPGLSGMPFSLGLAGAVVAVGVVGGGLWFLSRYLRDRRRDERSEKPRKLRSV